MKILSFLLVFICFSLCGQDKPLDVNKYLSFENVELVKSYIKEGHPDLLFVGRDQYGLVYPISDTCREESSVSFILFKEKDSDKYRFIKYSDCGKSETVERSKSLKYFDDNESEIRNDSLKVRTDISHTIYYSFLEFKNGELISYRYFCKACIDDESEGKVSKDQNTKVYKFFIKLDSELSTHIK